MSEATLGIDDKILGWMSFSEAPAVIILIKVEFRSLQGGRVAPKPRQVFSRSRTQIVARFGGAAAMLGFLFDVGEGAMSHCRILAHRQVLLYDAHGGNLCFFGTTFAAERVVDWCGNDRFATQAPRTVGYPCVDMVLGGFSWMSCSEGCFLCASSKSKHSIHGYTDM